MDAASAPLLPRRQLLRARPPVVVSWMFPLHGDAVAAFRAGGYQIVWLDGDHVAAFRHYMLRERGDPGAEAAFHAAMISILASGPARALGLPVICPFTPAGTFRPVGDIAAGVLQAAYQPGM
jgi:hypothetical protein